MNEWPQSEMVSISNCWLTGQRVYCMKCIVLYWNQKFTYRNTFATKTISQLTELRCCYILNFLGGVLVRGVVYMWRPERFCLDPATLCGKLQAQQREEERLLSQECVETFLLQACNACAAARAPCRWLRHCDVTSGRPTTSSTICLF